MSPTSREGETEAQRLLSYLTSDHLPDALAAVVEPVTVLAHQAVAVLPDGPELDAAIRKLVEAKDCLVRCRVDELRAADQPPVNRPEPFLLNDDEIQP